LVITHFVENKLVKIPKKDDHNILGKSSCQKHLPTALTITPRPVGRSLGVLGDKIMDLGGLGSVRR
jgi:hypothetical protein